MSDSASASSSSTSGIQFGNSGNMGGDSSGILIAVSIVVALAALIGLVFLIKK